MSMIWILFVLAIVAAALSILYGIWKVKYRYAARGYPQALCYHKITNRFCFEGTWTTPSRFFAQVDYLSDHGFRFIDETEFLAGLEEPPAGGERALFLTFDDGYREIHRFVLPGLVEREIPFHVFLVTDYSGRDNKWDLSLGRRPFRHLSWSDIEEMVGKGITFGSHGATHRDLIRLPERERMEELERSKQAIERRLNKPVRTFSYPFGRYDSALKLLARKAGYEAAFSLYPSHSNERVDRFALRRNAVYIIDTRGAILRKLERRRVSWFEEMKCRSINRVAALTPLFKTYSRNRDRRSQTSAGGGSGTE
jgi:peptidoglycan/xylan/chitin deacetylase (PgdA/CDA1 family)